MPDSVPAVERDQVEPVPADRRIRGADRSGGLVANGGHPHEVEPARGTDDASVFDDELRAQMEIFIDEHRSMLHHCLDGLDEDEARTSLVPSSTTLLGLVKHAAFVEQVWFGEAVQGLSRAELGIVAGPEESFALAEGDTIDTVREAHRAACATSRQAVADLTLDDVVTGNRRGPLPLRWVFLHVLRELAQHGGHADILREQVVASRT